MNIESPAIPYEFADLEPAMSRDTLVFHFLRHQRVCFDRMLAMVRGSELEGLPLDELIRVTERNPAQHTLYRYAAEVWNHNLFWHSMRPRGGGAAPGVVGEHIHARFGSYERFAREFKEAASAHFGSGWLWLVWRAGALEIVLTSNAGTPLVRGDTAILALDLWEHAYYLDHQNRRAAYVNTFLEELVNWDFANRTLANLAVNSDTRAVRVRTAAETDHGRLSAR
ncbi:MAG TPA: superoxide dismutase [Steroidobacteraceae bacterium]|nr:superoxide dismutase [Steroidobacteraceae bacterium]